MVEHRGIEPLTSGLQILAAVGIGMTDVRLTWEDATCVYLSKLAISGECPARCPAGFYWRHGRLFFTGSLYARFRIEEIVETPSGKGVQRCQLFYRQASKHFLC